MRLHPTWEEGVDEGLRGHDAGDREPSVRSGQEAKAARPRRRLRVLQGLGAGRGGVGGDACTQPQALQPKALQPQALQPTSSSARCLRKIHCSLPALDGNLAALQTCVNGLALPGPGPQRHQAPSS